jgi:hypothetical protein
MEGSASLFERGSARPAAIDLDAMRAPYLEQIGALKMELAFLKKKLKQLDHL